MSIFENQSALIADRYKITDTTFPLRAGGGEFQATGSFINNDTVTIGSKTYTFQTVLTNVDGNVQIAGISGTWLNLERAMGLTGTPGTDYAAATLIHPTATGMVDVGDDTFFDVTARLAGDAGNNIVLSESLTNGIVTSQMFGGISADTWVDFRKVTRRPARLALDEYEIYEENDFLKNPNNTIVGDVINLTTAKYVFRNTFVTAKRFALADGSTIEIVGSSFLTQNLIYLGTDILFSNLGAGVSRFYLRNISILLTSSGSTAFDIKGDSSPFAEVFINFIDLIWTAGGGILGTVKDFSFLTATLVIADGFKIGLTFQDVVFPNLTQSNYTGDSPLTGAALRFVGAKLGGFDLTTTGIVGGDPADSGIFISPTIQPLASINIDKVNIPIGNYFEPGTTGVITSIDDFSVTADPITGVIDASGDATFQHSGSETYFDGQQVTLSTFAVETTYNETGTLRNPNAGDFTVEKSDGTLIQFAGDDTGQTDSDAALVTSAGHGLVDAEPTLIINTINFNAAYNVFNTQSDVNEFAINLLVAFPGIETTGNFDTGSLTQKDKRVDLDNAGNQQASMNVGLAQMNGNAVSTTISLADTYQACVFNGTEQSPASELWTLINAVNGIFRYDGLNPGVASITALLWALKSGSTENYRLTISKNGAIPVFADEFFSPIEVKTTKTLTTVQKLISVAPGDTIQPMVAAEGTTNAITFTDLNFLPMI